MIELEDVKKHWESAKKGNAEWRTEAKNAYDFVAARQWSQEDIAALEAEERPYITFDRTQVFIDAISGLEVNNRQEVKYLPVERGDVKVNELLTNTAKFYDQACNAPDEDSEAAKDALICGIGVTETGIEYDLNPDGMVVTQRRNPLNTWYDPSAVRRNLKDRRYSFHGAWMPLEDAEALWPKANFGVEEPDGKIIPNADRAFEYKDEEVTDDDHEGQVFILQYQCWMKQDYWRMKDPSTGELVSLNEKQFAVAKKLFLEGTGAEPQEGRDFVKQRKKVYYRAFLSGGEFLEDPIEIPRFSFNFITYKRDQTKKIFYGIVRVMKDPQRWANKWLSQILHIVNSNAKGGVFAEATAFEDPRQAEEDWGKASPFILTREGAISQGKIKERTPAGYPTGLDRLMMLAFESLPMVTGVNLELLGLADREQAGVLEAQRRKSAYTILASFFSAIREYRIERGRTILAFIKNYIPNGALVRISGPQGEQWVPLEKDDLTYDVKVDQAPDSPDFKQQVWETMGQILPPMMKAGYPIPPDILSYSPLPSDVSDEWIDWIKNQGWMPPEHRQQMEQMQQQLQTLSQENQKLSEENVSLRVDSTLEQIKLGAKIKDAEEKNMLKARAIDVEDMNRKVESMVQAHNSVLDAKLRGIEIIADSHADEIKNAVKMFDLANKQLESEKKDLEIKKANRPKKASFKKVADGKYEAEIQRGNETVKALIEKQDGIFNYREL